MLPISALFAGLLMPLYGILAVRVILARRSEKVGIGDGGKSMLLRRMRAHANFAEYAPYALLLMALAESIAAPEALLYVCGIVLVAGRTIHAYGISQNPETITFRQIGMGSTLTVLGVLAVVCLVRAAQVLG